MLTYEDFGIRQTRLWLEAVAGFSAPGGTYDSEDRNFYWNWTDELLTAYKNLGGSENDSPWAYKMYDVRLDWPLCAQVIRKL